MNCAHSQCYHRVKYELSQHGSPRVARMLDVCRCEVSFADMFSLMDGFDQIKSTFRICKIVNKFPKDSYVAFNVRFLSVYILCYHPNNRFIKLICEVRLTLDKIRELNAQRRELKTTFDTVLGPKESTKQVKDIIRQLAKDSSALLCEFVRCQKKLQLRSKIHRNHSLTNASKTNDW